MAQLHRHILDTPSSRPNFLISMQFSGNFGRIIVWRPTLWGWCAPLGNSGPAPNKLFKKVINKIFTLQHINKRPICQTRMHSSRMRTACSLNISGGSAQGGVCPKGCLPGGGYAASAPTETQQQCSCLYTAAWSCDLQGMLGYLPPVDRQTLVKT